MSEYQFYEFRALDRHLTEMEMASLRKISSRAVITSSGFINTYNYGDFKGDFRQLVASYFDAFVYVSNFGVRRLIFKFPRTLVPEETLRPYCVHDNLMCRTVGEATLLEFKCECEEPEWEEGEDWLSSLIGIRSELIYGDLRSLYLGWLSGIQDGSLAEDEEEPPVPPLLKDLSAGLVSLCEFLLLPSGLLKVAMAASHEGTSDSEHRKVQAEWIKGLPPTTKDEILLRLLTTRDSLAGAELHRRYRASRNETESVERARPARRTVGELLKKSGREE